MPSLLTAQDWLIEFIIQLTLIEDNINFFINLDLKLNQITQRKRSIIHQRMDDK
jgi:hypothetical protein